MNAEHQHERYAEDVGAYLLGALDEHDERAFETHLDSCPICRDEVERLTVAVDVLPASVDQMAPPPELKKSLMAIAREEASAGARRPARSPRRWRDLLLARPAFAGAMAAVLLAIGIGVGALVGAAGGGDGGPSVRVASVDTSRLAGGAKASLWVPEGAGKNGGAVLRVTGMPLPAGRDVYEVWAKRGDSVEPVSLFDVTSDGNGSAAIPDKLDGVDAIYVTREKRGGAKVPTEKPVVAVNL